MTQMATPTSGFAMGGDAFTGEIPSRRAKYLRDGRNGDPNKHNEAKYLRDEKITYLASRKQFLRKPWISPRPLQPTAFWVAFPPHSTVSRQQGTPGEQVRPPVERKKGEGPFGLRPERKRRQATKMQQGFVKTKDGFVLRDLFFI